MPNVETEMEKTTYGPFERFLYLIFIPVIFTAILTVVLLSIFDYDVMNTVLRGVNKIPGVQKLVPDPPQNEWGTTEVVTAADDHDLDRDPDRDRVDEDRDQLEQQLAEQTAQIEQLAEMNREKELEIAQLSEELERLQSEREQFTIGDEEYVANIRRLSGVYANMLPSRAAAIIQNLTMGERVLVLNEMKAAEQVRILEKMDPVSAAETSILLKDAVPVKDRQIQALQERLNEYVEREETAPVALSHQELAMTFADMNADDAASLLLVMRNTNEAQVIRILRAMNVQARSAILAAVAEEEQAVAAQLAARLGE